MLESANSGEPVQDGRIHIEKIIGPMLFQLKATPAEYKAGLDRAIEKGWLVLHKSGTFVKFTQAGPICLRDPFTDGELRSVELLRVGPPGVLKSGRPLPTT